MSQISPFFVSCLLSLVLFAFYIYYQKRVFGNIKPSINRNKSVLGRSRELVSRFCSTLYILYLRNTWVRKLLFFLKCSVFLLFLLRYCLFFFHSVLHLRDTLLSFIGKGGSAPFILYMNPEAPPCPATSGSGYPGTPDSFNTG